MKRNNNLTWAWCVFIIAAVAFIVWVETCHYLNHERAQSYQYRVLISEDMNVADEKAEVSNEKEEAVKKDPESELYEETKFGILPKISPDGLRVLDAYSAHSDVKKDEKKIKTAIVLEDVAYNDISVYLSKLGKFKVTFIVPHYLPRLKEIVDTIRENGHEVFLQLPTQSSISANHKNSVSPFLANASAEDTILKLNCLLASVKHVIGVANISSTLFTKSKKDMNIVLDELSKRGLAFFDIEKSEEEQGEKGRGVVCFSDFEPFDKDFKVEKVAGKNGVLVPIEFLDEFLKVFTNVAPVSVTSEMSNADI